MGYLSLSVQEATTSPPSVLTVLVISQNTNLPLPYSKLGATNPRPLNPRGTEWWGLCPSRGGCQAGGRGWRLSRLLSGGLSSFLLLYTVHSTLGPSTCAPLDPGACPPFPSHTLHRQLHPRAGRWASPAMTEVWEPPQSLPWDCEGARHVLPSLAICTQSSAATTHCT